LPISQAPIDPFLPLLFDIYHPFSSLIGAFFGTGLPGAGESDYLGMWGHPTPRQPAVVVCDNDLRLAERFAGSFQDLQSRPQTCCTCL